MSADDYADSAQAERWKRCFKPIRDIIQNRRSKKQNLKYEIWQKVLDYLECNLAYYSIGNGGLYLSLSPVPPLSRVQLILEDLKSLFSEFDIPIELELEKLRFNPDSRIYELWFETDF